MTQHHDRFGIAVRTNVGWLNRAADNGGTPRKLNALPVISTPLKLSGANSPVIRTVSIDVAMTSENAGTAASFGSSSSW